MTCKNLLQRAVKQTKMEGGKIEMQQIIILHRQVNEMKCYPFNYLTLC